MVKNLALLIENLDSGVTELTIKSGQEALKFLHQKRTRHSVCVSFGVPRTSKVTAPQKVLGPLPPAWSESRQARTDWLLEREEYEIIFQWALESQDDVNAVRVHCTFIWNEFVKGHPPALLTSVAKAFEWSIRMQEEARNTEKITAEMSPGKELTCAPEESNFQKSTKKKKKKKKTRRNTRTSARSDEPLEREKVLEEEQKGEKNEEATAEEGQVGGDEEATQEEPPSGEHEEAIEEEPQSGEHEEATEEEPQSAEHEEATEEERQLGRDEAAANSEERHVLVSGGRTRKLSTTETLQLVLKKLDDVMGDIKVLKGDVKGLKGDIKGLHKSVTTTVDAILMHDFPSLN